MALDDEELTHKNNPELLGHEAAEQTLLDAFASGRMHHAWLITGPKGIGKATLAYRFARYALGQGAIAADDAGLTGGGLFGDPLPQDTPPVEGSGLAMSPDDPVFRRVANGAHGDITVVERAVDEKTGRKRAEIVINDVRAIGGFLSMTAAEGGWRVVVIDAADEMNRNAANAVLKVLEEPPDRALMLLVAHNPGRLLPTIRSRCRSLALSPLPDDTVSHLIKGHRPDLSETDAADLARLAEGSVGRALALADEGGLDFYRQLLEILSGLPRLDTGKLHTLGDRLARKGAEDSFITVTELLRWWLARLVLYGAGKPDTRANVQPDEKAVMDRLLTLRGLDCWLEVWEKIDRLVTRARGGGNLDRKQVVLNAFLALESAAGG